MFSKKILVLATIFVLATFVAPVALAGSPEGTAYTVKPGDNLWTLAEKYLGSGPAYSAIVAATNAKHQEDSTYAQIGAACVIKPGWKILIPTGSAAVVTSGSWTPTTKCEWLEVKVPQGNDGVDLQVWASKMLTTPTLKVPPERIRVHLYPCGNALTAFDGFILLGPREGNWTTQVKVTVPDYGAVDSYVGAQYSHSPIRIGQNTLRATTGIVTATTFSYWFWNDDDPPVSVSTAVTNTTGCVSPAQLATQMGWQNVTLVDATYGGFQVTLTVTSTLPVDWEAIGEGGKKILADDTNRDMAVGVWTVYSPYSCREALGYSK